MIASGRIACTAAKSRPIWSTTRGVKFSTITSQVAIRRSSRSRPAALCRSRVRPFLLVLSPEKIGDFSHHWSSVTGMPAISLVPSGRRVDSTWMTSAPSMASMWVHDGPAQNVVISSTRSPLERQVPRRDGRSGCWKAPFHDPNVRFGDSARCVRPAVAPARAGAAPRASSGRDGRAGRSRRGGSSRKTPRSTKWSRPATLAPLATGAFGIRNAVARSLISSTV